MARVEEEEEGAMGYTDCGGTKGDYLREEDQIEGERANKSRVECVKMPQQNPFPCMLTKNLVLKQAV